MKRPLSSLDPNSESTATHLPSPKRRKPSNPDLPIDPTSRPSSSAALPLTPETLQLLSSQQSQSSDDSTQYISRWKDDCHSCSEPGMAPPPTPSVASADSGQRRASKLSYRRQRSQSPSKKSSPQYRSQNMADASVFVDQFPEPPSDVEDQLKSIFGVSVLQDIGSRGLCADSAARNTIIELGGEYCHESRQLARGCAGEGEWKSQLLTGLMKPMQKLWPDTLQLSASEKPWLSELRPTPPSFEDMLDAEPPPPAPTDSSASIAQPQARVPAPPLPSPTQVLPQTPIFGAPSIAPSDSTTTDDPNRISTPKPDITIGLAHTSFPRLQAKILWDLQDNARVLSEPHQAGIGQHFPFLITEAKGLAAGSNMVAAQNQAAVAGAYALNIVRDLRLTGATARTTDAPCASPSPRTERQILFTVVTEGPLHELWVHFQVDEAYHMTLLRAWRTTLARDAREFVQALGRILEWGMGGFRTSVLKELTAIEAMFRGRRV